MHSHMNKMELTFDQSLTLVSALLAMMLTASEILSWSKCSANSLTQLLFSKCIIPPQPISPV